MRIRRGLMIMAAIAAGLILAVVVAIHTPMARGRALAWSSNFLTRYHLELEAGNLSYNAITRRITLTNVRLAAEGHKDRPFLVAGRIDVKLPWSVFRRRFAIDHLVIDNGIVDILRDKNNIVNLPPSSNAPTPEKARELDIRSLTLRGLDVQYEDQMRDWGVKIPRIESELLDSTLGAKGNFAVRGNLAFRLHQRVLTMAPFETVMTFDGSNVDLEQARLSSSEIEAFLSGHINRVLDSPSLDLALKGSVNLDNAIKWVPPPPVPVTGMATIEGKITGPARDFATELMVHSNTMDVGRERDLNVAGPVRVTFTAFSGQKLVIKPHTGGSITAAFTVPWGKASISTASAEWSGVDSQAALRMADVDPQAIGARFDGNGTFEFSDPHKFVIHNRSHGYARASAVAMTGTIDATIIGDDYRYDHDNTFPGFRLEGKMAGHIKHGAATLSTMTGPAHAFVTDVAAAAQSAATLGFPVAEIMFDVHGGIDAPMTLGGSYRYPEIQTTITGDAVDLPIIGRVAASASVDADPRTATISTINLRRGSSEITGDVVANLTDRTWSGNLRVSAPDALELQDQVPEASRVAGRITADAVLGGTFDNYRLDTTINGNTLVWMGQPIDRAIAKAIVTAEAIDVSSLEMHQGPGFLGGRVRYEWESGAYDASLKGDRLSWQGTVLSPNDTKAIFSVQFDGAGTVAQPKGHATLDFALTGGKAGTFIGAGEATADLLGDQARIVARLPSIGARLNADVATASPYDYRLNAQLERFELARLSPFMGAIETEVLGFANGTITASGRLADARDRVAFVNITELDAGIAGVPVSLLSPLNAELRGEDVTLKDLFVRIGSGRLSASGQWNTKLDGNFQSQYVGDLQDAVRLGKAFGVPYILDGSGAMQFNLRSNGSRLGTVGTLAINKGTFGWVGAPAAVQDLNINAALNGENLTIERITGNVATGGIIGSFSAKGTAKVPQLTFAAIDGALVLDSAKFTFSGIPVEQQRPSRIEFSKGNIAIADVSWLVAENPITFGGSVGFAAEDPPLNLSLKGLVDLRILSALTSAVAFDGNANVDTRINGTVARPLFDGRIMLDGAELAIADPRIVLSDLSGAIVLDGQQAMLDGVRGLANGGALALDGALEFDALALIGGVVNIQAQGVALELPKGLRSELDALVTFRPDPRDPSLTGDIRIVQSAYTETITIAALARQAALPVMAPTVQRPYLDRLHLNLALTTTDDVIVDNNYGRLAAGVDVRVIGSVSEPGVDGRITLRDGGQIFLAGRTFRITRGDISFTDRRHIHPEFNIAAEARVNGANVTMTLTGTLERPTIDLTSEDGSRTPGEIAAGIVGTANTETALTLLSADLLGVTGRAVGLDAFRIERGSFQDRDFRDYQEDPALISNSEDPTTRLTIGKRLSDQVEFTVSQNLRENGKATFVVSYFPRRNIELRGISRDSGTVSLGVRHQVTFGGGQSKPPSERRVRPLISGITFSGVDQAIAESAREQIKIKQGDEFDFLNLQKDVDRIRESFHEQGYLEARVRTRRVEAEDGSVSIEFVVTRGPRTILEIAGMTASSGLTAELEEAWHRNVFDQFLIDDLTHRVRRHLVESKDLASVVVGRIDRPDGDTKRLRIEVTPGVPVTGRQIRFAGNEALDEKQLLGDVVQSGLDIEAWLDRTVVEKALRQRYNEEGFLKAEVIGRPLEVDGTEGVLWFDIKEGPRAQVTSVKWTGVAESRIAEAEKAAAIQTPAAYVAKDITEARVRLEERYRRQGFNDVEVEAQPAIGPDDTVVLTFAVREGTQQILQDVQIAGNEVTNGKVLTQALRFELGKPVNLDEWTLARKRLYDTNVFRMVDIQPVPIGAPVDGVQQVKAAVNVEELPEWSVRYGFQLEGERQAQLDEFTSTRNAGVVGEIRNPNLFGRALTGGVFGMYQRNSQDASVFVATSRLFGWRARSTLYGFLARDRVLDPDGVDTLSTTRREGVSADQRWKTRGFQIVYGYRFERNHTAIPGPAGDPLPFDIVVNIAKLSEAIIWDRRDDPINSRKGTFSSVSFDQSALFLGSDRQNRKLLMQQFVFVPLRKIVFASRAQIGFALGRDDLAFTDRFRAGGATSVRGYGEESLGPRDPVTGLPLGGDRLIILNEEARFPIYRWANGVAFIDAGNILRKGEDWSGLKLGYGVGLRFDTPVGLLRGDVGFPQSPISTSRSNTLRFYFGFGHIF
ncbi:MAG TPA: translocation/assembly module TamB domain-containing protein [Vicinamibacterales bacterium]|nr:translocation/assembly module TamB domain-containing protein [Vicinamibacterales bacterium]